MKSKKVSHQEHFGRKFYEDKKTGYWISTDYPRIRAHRWVWINERGLIPKEYHVHHRNEDRGDNRIENLQLVSFRQHAMVHMDSDKLDRLRVMAALGREKSKEWHKSNEGRAWHKFHALKCGFGKNPPRTLECENCQKSYETTKLSNSRFCSNKCKAASRRSKGIDNEERLCTLCQKIFTTSRYSKAQCCSISCGKRLSLEKKSLYTNRCD